MSDTSPEAAGGSAPREPKPLSLTGVHICSGILKPIA